MFQFTAPPENLGAQTFIVNFALEDTQAALDFSQKNFVPRLAAKQPIALDFQNIKLLTQGYLHALLYESVRVAWALKTPIFIVNAQPAVRSILELLQNYALGG